MNEWVIQAEKHHAHLQSQTCKAGILCQITMHPVCNYMSALDMRQLAGSNTDIWQLLASSVQGARQTSLSCLPPPLSPLLRQMAGMVARRKSQEKIRYICFADRVCECGCARYLHVVRSSTEGYSISTEAVHWLTLHCML